MINFSRLGIISASILWLSSGVVLPGFEPLRLKGSTKEPQYFAPVQPNGRQYQQSVQDLLGKRWGGGTMIYVGGSGNDFAIFCVGEARPEKQEGG